MNAEPQKIKPINDGFACPICGEHVDYPRRALETRLGELGYLHVDHVVQCPRCLYTPIFGIELEDAAPPYVFPPEAEGNPHFERYQRRIKEESVKFDRCLICGERMEVHKQYYYTKRIKGLGEFDPNDPQHVQRLHVIHTTYRWYAKFISGCVLVQVKCTNPYCKYVRYFTI